MAKSANLPAPYKGIDAQTPLAALANPYCEDLLNFNTNATGIELRKGDSAFLTLALSVGGGGVPDKIFKYGNSKIFLGVSRGTNYDIYNLETGAWEYTQSGYPLAFPTFSSFGFNNHLFLLSLKTSGSLAYNGTTNTFGLLSYTGAGFLPIGGSSYKNRAYLIQSDSSAYWYSDIDAITGAVTQIDLSSIISEKSNLAIVTPVTVSETVSTEQFLAFVFYSGEVLFYSGSYPDSDDWKLVGKAQISSLIAINAGFDFGSDYIVLTNTGPVSLKEVLLTKSETTSNILDSKKIKSLWTSFVQAIRGNSGVASIDYVSGIWDKEKNRIIFSLGYVLNKTTNTVTPGSTFLIFDTELSAWTVHISAGFAGGFFNSSIISYRNLILLTPSFAAPGLTDLIIPMKEGSATHSDESLPLGSPVSYDYSMTTAPIPFTKTSAVETFGIEPIMESDLYAQTNWSLISDFGKQVSGNQNISDTVATTITKPLVNVGMQNNTYVQVKIAGATAVGKVIGLKLYSFNVWYDTGETGSR